MLTELRIFQVTVNCCSQKINKKEAPLSYWGHFYFHPLELPRLHIIPGHQVLAESLVCS